MYIEHVEIGNFRKLQSVRVDFAQTTTVFVGANNSGKTSAMVALRYFLVDRTKFSLDDFTLSNWKKLEDLGASWEKSASGGEQEAAFDWDAVLPHLDVWLNVPATDLHYVQKLLPTLDWNGALIGVRLRFEPKDVDSLRQAFIAARAAAASVMDKAKAVEVADGIGGEGEGGVAVGSAPAAAFELWPKSLVDFLAERLRYFEVRAYLLDPAHLVAPVHGLAKPQALPAGSEPIVGDPLKDIVQIDEISAQRGFGQATGSSQPDDGGQERSARGTRLLSTQLRRYYTHHLDPFDQPEPKDMEALQALFEAQTAFSERLKTSFAEPLKELEDIGYPGVSDPRLTITTNLKPVDGLNHPSAVQYEVPTHAVPGQGATLMHRLPEGSNGLGYQNLVSMVFELMSFRDRWMRRGKAAKSDEAAVGLIPPLHLVLVEEPEAHLHAQVQQVFIGQAYEVLRRHEKLQGSTKLRTQLIVSTHSSHVAHEADFGSLRYFRRLPVQPVPGAVPISSVVNLSGTFGPKEETSRFVKRYLKATHCDLFFADGAVLVEGPAERILVPHFVRTRPQHAFLKRRYVTWLEIGGSHAHKLRPLIEHLGLNTLVITDLDAMDDGKKSVPPARNANLETRNATLRTWVPAIEALDGLLDLPADKLVRSGEYDYGVRVAFQQATKALFKTATPAEALANTFEDALVYTNIATFQKMDGDALLGRIRKSLDGAEDLVTLSVLLNGALAKGGKAELAMDLLDSKEIDSMLLPAYIEQGLLWLAEQLKRKEDDVAGKGVAGKVSA